MKNILIIEDDLSIAELQRDYLELNGFNVTICTDGIKGLHMIDKIDIDLLILDIMLPNIDGYSILKKLGDEKDIPVLLVSAKKEEIDKIKGLSLGADDYITKPFSPSELVARVKSHIKNYERIKNKFTPKKNKIIIRGLEIIKDSMQVFVNGNEVNLPQKEFELLLYMCENPNKVFSREACPSNPQYIETVWGAGYRLRI
ncbi:response regulator transcription factor [Clostridium sp. cel8]|uniref:response regulator transcription factor n=1 Tax=Clostridium sp. cel8 TaxID=2663123 RepID=UPI0015F5C7E9|nr:response regulator transcription factor [Clostridium sp. cel8]MBA5851052.1 response regulator transcription factor [Clostridium sp. cel8]